MVCAGTTIIGPRDAVLNVTCGDSYEHPNAGQVCINMVIDGSNVKEMNIFSDGSTTQAMYNAQITGPVNEGLYTNIDCGAGEAQNCQNMKITSYYPTCYWRFKCDIDTCFSGGMSCR